MTHLIGEVPAMRRLLELVQRVAPTRAPVLVTGEAGTGKELIARTIHARSERAAAPFVPAHVGAYDEGRLEVELFGQATPGGHGDGDGSLSLVESANGGTLYLDNVSALSPAAQVRLLRVMQDRQLHRVGGGTPVPINVRVIAASTESLKDAVQAGRFREDLFYRLNVFPLVVPPLRERRADIPLLAAAIRERVANEHGLVAPAICADTMHRMTAYDWPGNVRELEHVMERAILLQAGAPTIAFDTPRPVAHHTDRPPVRRAAAEQWSLEKLEREYILAVLDSVNHHQMKAAAILGIDRRTLYRKLREYRAA